MLRQVLARRSTLKAATAISPRLARRSMLTAAKSKQKRPLNKQQLKGEKPSVHAPTATPASTAATTGEAKAATGGGGGGGPTPPPSTNAIPLILGFAAVTGGAAYYMDLIPADVLAMVGLQKDTRKVEAPADSESVKTLSSESSEKVEDTKVATDGEMLESQAANIEPSESSVPPAKDDASEKLEVSSDPPAVSTSSQATAIKPQEDDQVVKKPTHSGRYEATVDSAIKELQKELEARSSQSLSEAHQELAKLHSLDMSDIDNLTTTQLKVRLVQMAKDLEERTKWEAVRLKEFLAMKERETADEYLQILKKQRTESEDLLEKRLREQKEELTKLSEAALGEKDASLQSIIDSYLKVQEQQFLEEKTEFEEKTEEKFSAKYEELFGKSLAEAKDAYAARLDQKVKQLEEMAQKLSELELALDTSRDFQSGSVQAHRMSAAALALVDRLETSQPAAAEVAALQSVSGSDSVIDSALKALPKSSFGGGIPTLQELQARFEESVLPKSRQAAMVPAGQLGLEGQLLGMLFSTLKYAPGPDDPAPESEKDASEYVLARARRHVQLGELEQAVDQLDKLKGQVAFTARDWKGLAKDRVAVDKVLKVIRLECALANESMGKALE